ncbi:MAG: hypothetical protein VKK59_01055 [Vampirovibrionales bacterium]|nr:hypothetical protein [Vampirovibrionales bacterium]
MVVLFLLDSKQMRVSPPLFASQHAGSKAEPDDSLKSHEVKGSHDPASADANGVSRPSAVADKFTKKEVAQTPPASESVSSASEAASRQGRGWTRQDTRAAHAVFWKTVFPTALEFGAIASMPMLIGIPLAIASIPVCWMTSKFGDSLLKKVDTSQLSKNGHHLYEWAKFGEDFLTNPKELDRAKTLFNNLLDDVFEIPALKMLGAVPFISAAKERLKQQNIDKLKHFVGSSSKARGMDRYYMATLPTALLHAKTPLEKACTFIKHAAWIVFFKLTGLIGNVLDGISKVMPNILKLPLRGMAEFMKKINTLPAWYEGMQAVFSKPPAATVASKAV